MSSRASHRLTPPRPSAGGSKPTTPKVGAPAPPFVRHHPTTLAARKGEKKGKAPAKGRGKAKGLDRERVPTKGKTQGTTHSRGRHCHRHTRQAGTTATPLPASPPQEGEGPPRTDTGRHQTKAKASHNPENWTHTTLGRLGGIALLKLRVARQDRDHTINRQASAR